MRILKHRVMIRTAQPAMQDFPVSVLDAAAVVPAIPAWCASTAPGIVVGMIAGQQGTALWGVAVNGISPQMNVFFLNILCEAAGTSMAYICNDCGNKSTRKFPGGKCPGCDSFNIKSTHITTRQAIKDKEPKTLMEIVLLCLLWGVLGYGAWDKYFRKAPVIRPVPAASQESHMSKALEGKLKIAPAPETDF